MGLWDTKSDCIAFIVACYDNVNQYRAEAGGHTYLAWNSYDGIESGFTKSTIRELIRAVDDLVKAFLAIDCGVSGYSQPYAIPYFFETFQSGEETETTELTWLDIVTAWREAGELGRASTIIYIDAMRKGIWNKPVSFTDLAFPEGFQ